MPYTAACVVAAGAWLPACAGVGGGAGGGGWSLATDLGTLRGVGTTL